LDKAITWEEVHSAIVTLGDGKAAAEDGLVNELIRYSGMPGVLAITDLFRFLWDNCVWPEQWQVALLVLLFKGAGSRIDPSNYRTLALAPTLAKLFEKVVESRIREWAERVGALSDLQGGFRQNRSTIDQMFILNEIVTMRKEAGLPSFLVFLDVKKAYDRVWRDGLWFKLNALGLGGKCLAMLRQMFSTVVRKVYLNGNVSDGVGIDVGLPQGSVLSPLLYDVYINGLHEALEKANLGISVYGRLVPLLLFADDIVLLASTPAMLRKMLVVVEEYATKWIFEVNHFKCGLSVHGSSLVSRLMARYQWTFAGTVIPTVTEYRYLGVEFSRNTETETEKRLSSLCYIGAAYMNSGSSK
jgi:hypothetical protein